MFLLQFLSIWKKDFDLYFIHSTREIVLQQQQK